MAAAVCLSLIFSGHCFSQEKKLDGPRITAVAPFTLTPGQATTLHIRGLKLDTATSVLVQPSTAGLVIQMGEAKKSPPPNGADAKKYGDTEVEVKITAALPSAPLQLRIDTSAGRTPPVALPVVAASDSIAEKEPNGGFREAQPIELGKVVCGCIDSDKDVDVYRFDGKRGMKVVIAAEAAHWHSLADPMLTLFSGSGQIVAFGVPRPPDYGLNLRTLRGDLWGEADSRIMVTLPADGPYLISVYDAQDTSGPWHCYQLTAKETP